MFEIYNLWDFEQDLIQEDLWIDKPAEIDDWRLTNDMLEFDNVSELIERDPPHMDFLIQQQIDRADHEEIGELEFTLDNKCDDFNAFSELKYEDSTKSNNSGLKDKEDLKKGEGDAKVIMCLNRKDVVIKR